MKIRWNKEYTTIAIYALIVILISITFYLFASKLELFNIDLKNYINPMRPIFAGLAFAYILNLVMVEIETSKHLALHTRFKKKRDVRIASMVLTYLAFAIFVYFLVKFVIPQLAVSIASLANSIPDAITELSKVFDESLANADLSEATVAKIIEKRNEFVDYVIKFAGSLIPYIKGLVLNTVEGIWNIVLGVIVSSYLLIEKEHFIAIIKKFIATFSGKTRYDRLIYIGRLSNGIFQRFIGGKVLDSLIIGLISYVVMLLAGMPYLLLVTFIITVTNVIPFFGPFIGAVPSFFIILSAAPTKALWFVPIIFIIQQLDGNYIGPKILGGKLGVSPFWILFSLLVFGKMLGIMGLVIGVPLFMVIYELVKEYINERLERKGLPTDNDAYMND